MSLPDRIALDTSVVVTLLRDVPSFSPVRARLAAVLELYLPLMTLGELEFGVACSSSRRARIQLDSTLSELQLELLLPYEQTAMSFARLKKHLRVKGRHIPETDLWIAATAHSHGLALLCRDEHFNELSDMMEIVQVG